MHRGDENLENLTAGHRYLTGDPSLDEAITQLVLRAAPQSDTHLVTEIIATALRLARDQATRGDMKILSRALRELRYAFKVFRPYRHIRKVSVFGSARVPANDPAFMQARHFGKLIVKEGFMVITGAGDGIMGAAQQGAGGEMSFGVNILLPFEQQPNEAIRNDHKLMTFKYFFGRKLVFLKESDAVVLFPGGFGTHDEGFESLTLLQTGKAQPAPIVFVQPPGHAYWQDWNRYVRSHLVRSGYVSRNDVKLYRVVSSAEEAVQEICNFYRVFHSSRYVGNLLVLRLQVEPPRKVIAALNKEFKDIIASGEMYLEGPLPAEASEPELKHLPRLVFAFNKRDFGRLRMLIDSLNSCMPDFCPGRIAERYDPALANGNGGSEQDGDRG